MEVDPSGEARESKLFRRALEEVGGASHESAAHDAPSARHEPPRSDTPGDGGPLCPPGYDLVRLIGSGGQGAVYEAWHRASRRRMAIKVLSRGVRSQSDRARFDREIEIVGGIDHPGVAAIRDSGEIRGALFLAMDYVDGVSLDEWLAREARDDREVVDLFIAICSAMNAAHLRGVIHRDLKPANILVDGAGRPHVVDFGLARPGGSTDASGITMTGQFVGSLPWSSPEQARGMTSDLDIRSDVYALGILLYHALTGTFPYPVAGSLREIVRHVCETDAAPPSELRRALGRSPVHPDLEAIVLRCLGKERDRRYQSAGELGRDLGRFLAGEPVEARRDSRWYLLQRTASRHRVEVGAGALLVTFLAVVAIVMTVLRGQAREEAGRAEQARQRAQESERRARAVVGALQGVLRSVDPAKMMGDTSEDVVRIEREHIGMVAGDPELEAELRLAIAIGYLYNTDRNLRICMPGLARQIVALDALTLTDTDRDRALRFRIDLLRAALEHRMDGPMAAEPIYQRLAEEARGDPRIAPTDLIAVQVARALNFTATGQPSRAIECATEALEVGERAGGRWSVPASFGRYALARALVADGRCAEAMALFDRIEKETAAAPVDDRAAQECRIGALNGLIFVLLECGDPPATAPHRQALQGIFDELAREFAEEVAPARRHRAATESTAGVE